jgi:hypothetical protein
MSLRWISVMRKSKSKTPCLKSYAGSIKNFNNVNLPFAPHWFSLTLEQSQCSDKLNVAAPLTECRTTTCDKNYVTKVWKLLKCREERHFSYYFTNWWEAKKEAVREKLWVITRWGYQCIRDNRRNINDHTASEESMIKRKKNVWECLKPSQ